MDKLEIKPIRFGKVDYRELMPLQPENYKTLGPTNFRKMWKAISEKGFRVPFQIWESEADGCMFILDGHQRRRFINTCQQKGIPLVLDGQETFEVPVVYIHCDNKKDAAEMLLAIDSQYGDRELEGIVDFMELYEIEHSWMDGATVFDETFDGMESAMRRLEAMKENLTAAEDDFIPDLNVSYDIKEGDVIEIGPHRLICGDSTKLETYERLFGDDRADMVNTDPPYNVDYEGGTNKQKIMNDNMEEGEFFQFLHNFYSNLNRFVKAGGAWYVWHADSEGAAFRMAMKGTGILFKQVLIWVKNHFTLGRQDYQWQHEPCIDAVSFDLKTHDPCLYGWKKGAAHEWYSDRKQSTVLEFPKPLANSEHPTMKPVPMIGYQIQNNSVPGDIVADGFAGSGTCMVACEQLERKCYCVELDPRFCNVIIDRMLKINPEILIKVNGEPLKGLVN